MDRAAEPRAPSSNLDEMLEETRILLPGSEVLVAFLISVPFSNRFTVLTHAQRIVYLVTFLSAIVAFVCFLMPAAYHRLARPISSKGAFKVLATRFLVMGMMPMSVALIAASHLVTSLAYDDTIATIVAGSVAALIALVWWVMPITRFHDRYDRRPRRGRDARAELESPDRL
jgi:ABC-type maltose transport system permease subunit